MVTLKVEVKGKQREVRLILDLLEALVKTNDIELIEGLYEGIRFTIKK